MPNLSATTLFSNSARDDALVDRRLNEMAAFRDIADYAMRRHALALPMVREDHFRKTGKSFERGHDYLAGIQAADACTFLHAFAEARIRGVGYEAAVREALISPDGLMIPHYEDYSSGYLDDSVRQWSQRSNDMGMLSDQHAVRQAASIESLYAMNFLRMHMARNNRVITGSLLGIEAIQCDLVNSMNEGTGLEHAARDANATPEVQFFAHVGDWLDRQFRQSLMLEAGMLNALKSEGRCDERSRAMLDRNAFYRNLCGQMKNALGVAVKSGLYMAYYHMAADKAGDKGMLDPVVALHECMDKLLKAQIEVIQAGEAPFCRPEDAPVFADAYQALMNAIDREFPLAKPPVLGVTPPAPGPA